MKIQYEIKSLTSIRGVAACYVMLYHYFYAMDGAGPAGPFLRDGYLSVDLFFVLSGFVMALTYGNAFIRGFSGALYLRFLSKRLGRVYPLYIVITLAVAALVYAGAITAVPPSGRELVTNALLVQGWGFADSIVDPSWSISTEFAAYLLFPLLIATVQSTRWIAVTAAAALAVLVFVATRSTVELHQIPAGLPVRSGPLDAYGPHSIYPLLRCIAGFTLGLLAFRLTQVASVRRLARLRFAGDVAVVSVVVLMAVRGSDIVLVALFVPLVVTLGEERSLAAWVLRRKPLHWLGEVSYSIYLIHRPADGLFRKPLTDGLNALHVPHAYSAGAAVLVVAVIALSAVTYYGIERPARDWTRKLVRRPASPVAVTTV